jgi:thiamine-monophosphate kinase
MSGHTTLGPGGEFDRIRRILSSLGANARGIGDDAALVDIPVGHKLVASTDSSVEGVHFRRDWMTFEEIGYRATAAALSDIAAMGAAPLGVLLAIALPESDLDSLDSLVRGCGEAAKVSGTAVIGGDLSGSPTLTIGVTVLGSAVRPISRNGAAAGDRIYMTGKLGGSGLGLAAMQRGEAPPAGAREKFVRPIPRIPEAAWLADRGATACIDISDGIVGDLGHIALASGVNLLVDIERIPLFPGAASDTALSSGEEYELCVTAPQDLDVEGFRSAFSLQLTLIGYVESSTSPGVIFRKSGAQVRASGSFTHFTK